MNTVYADSSNLHFVNSDIDSTAIECISSSEILIFSSNLTSYPEFADTTSGDFHLNSSSPCIDAGAESVYIAIWDTTIYAPLEDIDGNPRPRGETWDIGAYESPYDNIDDANIDKPVALAISVYPNPFNSAVTITAPADAEIEVFDVNGRRVSVIANRDQPVISMKALSEEKSPAYPNEISRQARNDSEGGVRNDSSREFVWRPSPSLGSGVYLVRAKIGEQSTSRKIILNK